MKERVVPGQDLVDKNFAIPLQTARPFGNAHSQRECLLRCNLGGQRQDHGAFQTCLTKFRGLDSQAWPLLPRLSPNPRFQLDDIEMPAAGKQGQIIFSLERT